MTTAVLAWRPVGTGDATVAVAERDALGTTARVAVWPPADLDPVLVAVDRVLDELDRQASRFRDDSEITWLHGHQGGVFLISAGLAQAIRVALEAARWTDGRVDPTVGAALAALGYDRDFAAVQPIRADAPAAPEPAPGWRCVHLHGRLLQLPAGVRLDLGATAKGLGADRCVRACAIQGGVLVSLGGDIAVGGTPPLGGWPIEVQADGAPAGSVRLTGGAVATSSTECRSWWRAGRKLHHIVDPRTGLPAAGRWRSVSVAAATCADANAAATATVVAGTEEWLVSTGLPARLVGVDGAVRRCGGWPADEGGGLAPASVSQVYPR